mgnify:CR=1 FL=1
MIFIIEQNLKSIFSLLPYGCLATGYCSGIIEVVRDSQTIMNVQELSGFKGQYQFDPSALYRWIAQNNQGADKLVNLFAISDIKQQE